MAKPKTNVEIVPSTDLDAAPSEEVRVRGFWSEAWHRFRQRKLAMAALGFVGFLTLVAIFSPAIAGTKPIVCKYKGKIYFPCLAYFNERWEHPTLRTEKVAPRAYTRKLKKENGDWAIWPLVFQDPERRVRRNQWPGRPGNPHGKSGKPTWMLEEEEAKPPPKRRESDPDPVPVYNIFGTTPEGKDVFAMMVHGTRIALLVGFVSTGIAAVIGIVVGAMAGFLGGIVDTILSRLIEVVMCVPSLILVLALHPMISSPTIWHMMVLIGIAGWTGIARLTRAEFLKLRNAEYVTAARAMGASRMRLMFRHILPNALTPVLVPIAFGIAGAILVEAGLSFLGFSASPPNSSWGEVLKIGQDNLQMWWLIVFPGIAIFLTVLAYNLIGEGLQEATDPRLRQAGH